MRKILVITKFRYMGDTIVATPFLRRLSEALPYAEVTVLAGPFVTELLQGCPFVGETWPLSSADDGGLRGTAAVARRIRRAGFDTAFLLNRSLHSAIVTALAGVPRRVGFETEYRGPLLTTRVHYDKSKPERESLLDLLRAVNLPAQDALPELWVSREEQAQARQLLCERDLDAAELLVAVHPGANDSHVREWPLDRFAKVADRLAATHHARIILMGNRAERATSEAVAGAMSHRPVILTGETSLREALSVLSLCRLWVGNDGGMLHAAVALGPATVGIFGPTKAPRWSYNLPRHRAAVAWPDRPIRTNAEIRYCIDAVTADSVYELAVEVMGK